MSGFQRTCFVCKKEIYMQRNEQNTGWIIENPDGTPHENHPKKFAKAESPRPKQDQSIERMHNENIEAIKKLTAAIEKLANSYKGKKA